MESHPERIEMRRPTTPPRLSAFFDLLDGLHPDDFSLVLTVEEQFELTDQVIRYLEHLTKTSRTMTAEMKAKIQTMATELQCPQEDTGSIEEGVSVAPHAVALRSHHRMQQQQETPVRCRMQFDDHHINLSSSAFSTAAVKLEIASGLSRYSAAPAASAAVRPAWEARHHDRWRWLGQPPHSADKVQAITVRQANIRDEELQRLMVEKRQPISHSMG